QPGRRREQLETAHLQRGESQRVGDQARRGGRLRLRKGERRPVPSHLARAPLPIRLKQPGASNAEPLDELRERDAEGVQWVLGGRAGCGDRGQRSEELSGQRRLRHGWLQTENYRARSPRRAMYV